MRAKDLAVLGLALAAACAAPLFCWALGGSPWWGDLSYLHHPWRALSSEMLQRGELPLWNPYAYLGMPLAAEMQCAAWYPGTLPFYLFSFPLGLAVYHALHFGLLGFFAALWLRKEGFCRFSSCAGAIFLMGCGSLASRVPFLNHLSTLAYMPVLFLFRKSWALLGLAFALSFLSGYPLMLAGCAGLALFLPWILKNSKVEGLPWLKAALLSAGLSACLLLPALELAIHSHRGAGLGLEDTLMFGMTPEDWKQWIGPMVLPSGEFSPSKFWWKTCYFGIFSWIAIFLSISRLKRGERLKISAYILLVACLLLGGSNPLSRWIWAHVVILKYVRYPGNLAYLLLPAFAFLTAMGLNRRKWAPYFIGGLGLELLVYAVLFQPLMPSRVFLASGPVAKELQRSMEHRYYLSPNATHWSQGTSILDWQSRLYGLRNMPYHLSSATNFGEPLVPNLEYDYMDFLFSRNGIDSAAPYLAWSDVKWVLTRDLLPSKRLRYSGENIWHWYQSPGRLARAFWFDGKSGEGIPPGLGNPELLPAISKAFPLDFDRIREDRYRVRGKTEEGWLYLAEPKLGGWEFRLDGRRVSGEPAMGAFQKFRVPSGEWELRARYFPLSWMMGLTLTGLFLGGLGAYWYNQALSRFPTLFSGK